MNIWLQLIDVEGPEEFMVGFRPFSLLSAFPLPKPRCSNPLHLRVEGNTSPFSRVFSKSPGLCMSDIYGKVTNLILTKELVIQVA